MRLGGLCAQDAVRNGERYCVQLHVSVFGDLAPGARGWWTRV